MTDEMCATCGSLAEGFKCAECGLEQGEFDSGHFCGDDQVMPKCSGCAQVETQCACDGI